jgi:hypothetical protein
MNPTLIACIAVASALAPTSAVAATWTIGETSHDRWMYPSNGTPGTRAQASTFSALPGNAGMDDRWGFFLLAFDTASALPPGLPASRYRVKSVKIKATISQNNSFIHDPTYDPWQTYATPSVPVSIADADIGRPLELHGAGFRNGFSAATFIETSAHGPVSPGARNAFPFGFDAVGTGRDVSNNITGQFDSIPWAVGETSTVSAGDPVPIDTEFTFNLNPSLPGVADYLRQGLAAGRIWFSITSLHPAIQQGGQLASFHTRDDVYHQLFGGLAPSMSLDAELDIQLSITRAGNQVTVSWPEFAGFTHTLQSSSTLSPGSWTRVVSHPAITSGTGSHTENADSGSRFYRIALVPSL